MNPRTHFDRPLWQRALFFLVYLIPVGLFLLFWQTAEWFHFKVWNTRAGNWLVGKCRDVEDAWRVRLDPTYHWCRACAQDQHEKTHNVRGWNSHGLDVWYCDNSTCPCTDLIPMTRRTKRTRFPWV